MFRPQKKSLYIIKLSTQKRTYLRLSTFRPQKITIHNNLHTNTYIFVVKMKMDTHVPSTTIFPSRLWMSSLISNNFP